MQEFFINPGNKCKNCTQFLQFSARMDLFKTLICLNQDMNSDKELQNQCLEEKRLKRLKPLEPVPVGNFLDIDMPPHENGEREKSSITRDIPGNTQSISSFMELQEADNISKAAYKELMTIAVEAKTWVVSTPALGSLEEQLEMFRRPPPSGMRVERSVESAIVPVDPEDLVTIMMDVNKWTSLLSHIVFHGSEDVRDGIILQLSRTDTITKKLMVYAELQLPMPYVPARAFHFLRCLRVIRPNIWAIVDLSDDYFPFKCDSAFVTVCQRRPSGLIVRRHGNYSQVIWIENVLVNEYKLQNGVNYGMISSNFPFSAKHWVSALIWKLGRYYSRFINVKMEVVNQCVHTSLLNLTDSMKDCFLDMVGEIPDASKWVTLSNRDIKILRNLTIFHGNILSSNDYIAVACFRVQAKPISVFNFLIKKNMELQWPRSLNLEEPEEVIKFASDNDSNCITLHSIVIRNQSFKNEYLLREASTDGFFYFVISAPMTQLDVNNAFFHDRWRETLLQPSGFAIMPGGSDGLHSDVSLVTIAIQQECDISDADEVVKFLSGRIGITIEDIHEEILSGCKAYR